jgi:nucleotide-binding universal stress UspA family protein
LDLNTIRNILIPIDFSESSLNAFESALSIAEKANAGVHIIHIHDTAYDAEITSAILPGLRYKDNKEEVLNALTDIADYRLGKTPKLILLEGDVSPTIVKIAEEFDCNLIIMGTHGASGFRENFVGTNTYNVIKHASCPVLAIPTKKKCIVFRKLFFPVKPLHSALKRYGFVHNISSNNEDRTLHILCLSSTQREDDEQMLTYLVDELKEKLSDEPVEIYTQYSYTNNLADIILQTADQIKADMIVLTPSIDITNKQYFIGPYSQKVIHQAKVPVLVIKRNS